jgi:hypothetical protein
VRENRVARAVALVVPISDISGVLHEAIVVLFFAKKIYSRESS